MTKAQSTQTKKSPTRAHKAPKRVTTVSKAPSEAAANRARHATRGAKPVPKLPPYGTDTMPGKALAIYRRHDTPTLPILNAVNDLWREIQANNPGTPNVAIVLQASEYAHGHFAPGSWTGSAEHELMLSTVSLAIHTNDGAIVKTVSTLLHEAAHAYAHANGIKDTSRQGRWHNKEFARLAEKFGCQVESNSQIGHTTSGITVQARLTYARQIDALQAAVTTYRKSRGFDWGQLFGTPGTAPVMRTRTRRPAPPKGTPGARNVSVSCECDTVTVLARLADTATIHCDLCDTDYS